MVFKLVFRCIEHTVNHFITYQTFLCIYLYFSLNYVVRLCANPSLCSMILDYHSLAVNQMRSRRRHASPGFRVVIKSLRLLFQPPQLSSVHHHNYCSEIQLKQSLFFQWNKRLGESLTCFLEIYFILVWSSHKIDEHFAYFFSVPLIIYL